MEFFTILGLTIGLTIVIVLLTGIMGFAADDDDFAMRWVMTSFCYALTLACLITGVIKIG